MPEEKLAASWSSLLTFQVWLGLKYTPWNINLELFQQIEVYISPKVIKEVQMCITPLPEYYTGQ